MRVFLINFFTILFMIFLLVALGQWNHRNFQGKAYNQGKELIFAHLSSEGEKQGDFIEPPDLSTDVIHVEVITGEDWKYSYEIGIMNPLWVQLTALNLFVSPKVEIVGAVRSER